MYDKIILEKYASNDTNIYGAFDRVIKIVVDLIKQNIGDTDAILESARQVLKQLAQQIDIPYLPSFIEVKFEDLLIEHTIRVIKKLCSLS